MGCRNLARYGLTCALFVLISHTRAVAAGPTFDLAEAGAADSSITFTIDRPGLDATVRIANKGDAGKLRIVSTPLQAPDGQVVETQWTLLSAGKTLQPGDPLPVAARGTIDVRMKASLGRPGRHVTRLTLYMVPDSGAEVLQRTIAVVVERQTKTLNEDLITSPAPPLVDKALPLLSTDATVRIGLRNSAGGTLELRPPVLLEVTRTVSGTQVASLELGDIQPTHSCPGPAGVISLSADDVCMASFKIPNVPSAGAYTAKISVSGLHGGRRQADVAFNVRLHWIWAALLVLAGIVVGGFITSWRTRGRELFRDLAEVATLQRRLDQIREPAKARSLDWVVGEVQDDVVKLRSEIYTGAATQVAESIQRLRVRVAQLSNWLALESAFVELDLQEQRAVNDDLKALRDLLANRVLASSTQVDEKLNGLRERIARARKWTGIRRDRAVLAKRVLPPVRVLSQITPELDQLRQVADANLQTLNGLIAAREAGQIADNDEEVKKAGDALLAAVAAFLGLAEATLKHDRVKPAWIPPEARTSLAAGLDALQSRAVDAMTADSLESALDRYVHAAIGGLRAAATDQAQNATGAKLKNLQSIVTALGTVAGADLTETIKLYVEQSEAFQAATALPAADAASSPPSPPATTPAPEARSDALAIEWNLAWLVPENAPPERVARLARTIELVVDLAIMFVLSIVAVQTLWVPNPSWGALGDLMTAFLVGAAAYAGIGTAIQQWTTQLQRR
jgi:hypothetical protein